jgi:hypothetical protein
MLIRQKPKNPVKIVMERFPGKVVFEKPVVKFRKVSVDVVVDNVGKEGSVL